MPSTGPTVFAGAPSVIAQISLESEAFRVAGLNPGRAAGSIRPTGSPAPGMTDWGPARWRLVPSSPRPDLSVCPALAPRGREGRNDRSHDGDGRADRMRSVIDKAARADADGPQTALEADQ